MASSSVSARGSLSCGLVRGPFVGWVLRALRGCAELAHAFIDSDGFAYDPGPGGEPRSSEEFHWIESRRVGGQLADSGPEGNGRSGVVVGRGFGEPSRDSKAFGSFLADNDLCTWSRSLLDSGSFSADSAGVEIVTAGGVIRG
jgi:hypothetical protein